MCTSAKAVRCSVTLSYCNCSTQTICDTYLKVWDRPSGFIASAARKAIRMAYVPLRYCILASKGNLTATVESVGARNPFVCGSNSCMSSGTTAISPRMILSATALQLKEQCLANARSCRWRTCKFLSHRPVKSKIS